MARGASRPARTRSRRLGFDEKFMRLWTYYLCYCEAAFREQATDVGFFLARKIRSDFMKMLAVYVATLVVFTGVDFVWLGRMGDSFYRPAMGGLAMDGFRLGPAIVFYLLYALGIVFFAVSPALAAQSWKMAAALWPGARPRRLWRL